MEITKSFEKRIKRRITGRKHVFFAVCAPGLKRLCQRELLKLPIKLENISMIKGGVEFTGFVHDCYFANLFLRSPSRIKMRITKFKAENFRTLEKKLKKIEWELYLQKNSVINYKVSTTHSRLFHKKAISDRAENIITNHLKQFGYAAKIDNKNNCHIIFIRGENNEFEISIDATGDLLHKRGIKKNVGKACLRENIAFGILSACKYSGREPFIDPMCGSGTFSLEACMIKQNIAPGFFRKFAFEKWQCFRKNRWNYFKKETEKAIIPKNKTEIFACDIDKNALLNLEKNISSSSFFSGIKVFHQDFFDLIPEKLTSDKGVIILNPPYGKRFQEKKQIKNFYTEINKKLKKDFKGWQAGIMFPEKNLLNTLCFSASLIPIFHGGLNIYAATGKIT
ncbi:MAG: hypothetical protein B6I26_03385 [Desulfobacteraceae bacterium 4572_130]|nr:MAG: hypothetical protein B6I26_03385 [Desulfobacteraceae bacterium 4572_130]